MGGIKLALALLAVATLTGISLGTWQVLTFTSNGWQGIEPFPTTVTGTHYLQVNAPAQGTLEAVVEEPLGLQVLQAAASDGACDKDSGTLQWATGYYGFSATCTNYQSGTGKAYVADVANAYRLPQCQGS